MCNTLTLNVPGDCGSSRPTRVESRLHCVGIEWQVRGRCVGSAAHSPLHAIAACALSAARTIEPRPTHFARVRALGVPRTHNAARACYVAICDRRILWRCRNLWLKVSQFVTGVAICDGKCRNLWQRQNMQFNDIYSPNFDKYFVLSSYLYLCETYFSRLSLNFVSSIIVFIHELFGHSNSLLMAHNSKSHNDVRCLQQ